MVYNADVYLGKYAKELGLVDEIGSYREVAAREFPENRVVEYFDEESSFKRLISSDWLFMSKINTP